MFTTGVLLNVLSRFDTVIIRNKYIPLYNLHRLVFCAYIMYNMVSGLVEIEVIAIEALSFYQCVTIFMVGIV